jgi:hypothetical protein
MFVGPVDADRNDTGVDARVPDGARQVLALIKADRKLGKDDDSWRRDDHQRQPER